MLSGSSSILTEDNPVPSSNWNIKHSDIRPQEAFIGCTIISFIQLVLSPCTWIFSTIPVKWEKWTILHILCDAMLPKLILQYVYCAALLIIILMVLFVLFFVFIYFYVFLSLFFYLSLLNRQNTTMHFQVLLTFKRLLGGEIGGFPFATCFKMTLEWLRVHWLIWLCRC